MLKYQKLFCLFQWWLEYYTRHRMSKWKCECRSQCNRNNLRFTKRLSPIMNSWVHLMRCRWRVFIQNNQGVSWICFLNSEIACSAYKPGMSVILLCSESGVSGGASQISLLRKMIAEHAQYICYISNNGKCFRWYYLWLDWWSAVIIYMVFILGDNVMIHDYDMKEKSKLWVCFGALSSFSPQIVLSQVKQDVFGHFLN